MIQMIMSAKFLKSSGLLGIWYLNQIAPQAETLFGRLLEYGVSFALLGLVAFIFYREWKTSDTYNKERDVKLETLIENNTAAMRDTKDAIDDMREEQKYFRNELKTIHSRVNDNTNRINRWDESR